MASRKKSLPVSRNAIRSGAMFPTTCGTTGAGNRKTPSARSGSSATFSPSPPKSWKPSALWKPSTRLAIPPYYFSLINPDDPNDPIRLQSVPSPLESRIRRGIELEDPLEEDKDSPVPGLTHRYPDRCLAGHHARLHHVLPLLHAQTGHHGPRRLGRHQPQRRTHDRVRPRSSRNPRRHRLRRRPADLAGQQAAFLPGQPGARSRMSMSSASARACRSTLPQKLYDPELVDLLASAGRSGFRRTSTIRARSRRKRPASA